MSVSGETFLNEGSENPVSTATVLGLADMNPRSVNASSATVTSSYLNSSTSTNDNRISSISTSFEAGGSGPYEVVYTGKTTGVEGSEEIITLHFGLDETNKTLLDEVAATESLLMLSEIRDNSKSQGISH